jgi:TonB-dependent SusC/RagA subfamily outer membrane receptor
VNPNVTISKEEPRLSNFEKRLLYKYILPYQYRYGEYYAYIEQNGQVQFLKPSVNYNSTNLAGPVYPNQARFQLVDSFSIDFVHEPLFEYEFMPELLKMRSIDPETKYPDFLYNYQARESISDEVLKESDILEGWNEYKEWKRYSTARYNYPRNTTGGMGKMEFRIIDDTVISRNTALNILVFRYDDHKFLRIYPGNSALYNDLSEGYYKLLFFYPGASYSILDSLYVEPNGLNYYQIEKPEITKKDSFSIYVSKIIEDNIFRKKSYYQAEATEIKQIYNAYQQEFRFTGNGDIVSGYVYDSEGMPIPGVSVVVKGTTFGTITNIDGYYSLNVPKDRNELSFSFIGFKDKLVDISYKDVVNVSMTEDVVALDEVVVIGYGVQRKSELTESVSVVSTTGIPGIESNLVGALQGKVAGVQILKPGIPGSAVSIRIRGTNTIDFDSTPLYVIDGVVFMGDIGELNPDLIKNIQILKDAQATALYGSQGANGVVIINTGGSFKSAASMLSLGAEYDETFLEAANNASSIRNNFSDYAFWNPKLITDKEGKVTFSVQFPDDVTNWRTFYLGMNGNKQSGQAEGSIKSYKPLMAQLAVPRFLVEADTTYAIGKVLNYTPDSINLTTKFELNGESLMENSQVCSRSVIDSLELIADSPDSLSVKYFLEKKDGYFDGELKYVPIYPIGLEQTAGQFHSLQGDTSLILSFDTAYNEVKINARADILEVIEEEISKLIHYKYSCNEQLASKLKALLSEQTISQYRGDKFRNMNEVERVIRLLLRNQKEEGLWGWWKSSKESSLWISLHVLEALAQAKELGYKVNINEGQIADLLVWELESPEKADNKLRALHILKMLDSKVNFPIYIDRIEKSETMNMNELFRLIEIKQLCGLNPEVDTINSFRKETIFGNLYFTDDSVSRYFFTNDIQNTLIAYRILRSDSTIDHSFELQKIRNYLFENRSNGCWLNTFETSKIIETILPELLGSDRQINEPVLTFSGSLNKTVDEFPFEVTVSSNDTISITKRGDFPVYLTAYSHFWNPTPLEKNSDFEISTRFDISDNNLLKAGQPVKMVARVRVLKDADYVMINVPIPAGCSYGNKSNSSFQEVHREYFRNETAIFCESLRAGDYEFVIELIPRYTGRYTVNPAKIEMMYFPTFNANNGTKKVTIK